MSNAKQAPQDQDRMYVIHNSECSHHNEYLPADQQYKDCGCTRRFEDSKNPRTWELAVAEAARLTELLGDKFLPVDQGDYCWPRYEVKRAPRKGDMVSYSFNGDTYPCGFISSVSDSCRVVCTTEGKKFYRRKLSGSWINNGTWSLVGGHRHEQNPSF